MDQLFIIKVFATIHLHTYTLHTVIDKEILLFYLLNNFKIKDRQIGCPVLVCVPVADQLVVFCTKIINKIKQVQKAMLGVDLDCFSLFVWCGNDCFSQNSTALDNNIFCVREMTR